MEELLTKLDGEYYTSLQKVDGLKPQQAIERYAYEFITKKAIIEYIEDLELEDDLINYMMSIDGLLNQFYSDWLSFDGRLYDGSLEASIDNSIDIIENEL